MDNYSGLEEIIFSMIMYVQKTDVSMLKEYKLSCLMDFMLSRKQKNMFDTYDEYYEDIDEKLKETNKNFFEEVYNEYDERFSCNGVLDDDDLSDYDELINIIK